MDLIVDPDSNAILNLVEKSTSILFIQKLSMGKQSKPLGQGSHKDAPSIQKVHQDDNYRQGGKVCAHKDITKCLGVSVPTHHRKREPIENMKKLIRQYIQKGKF